MHLHCDQNEKRRFIASLAGNGIDDQAGREKNLLDTATLQQHTCT
jgi:hypothetical protein